MKIAVVGDVHWSAYSSIIRSRGEKYSTRLENLINTVNWCEQEADKKLCDVMVYLGDFFDRPDINAEEISALSQIGWNYQPHFILAGNHEMGRALGDYSTAYALNSSETEMTIVTAPCEIVDEFDNHIGFLPYILEANRGTIESDIGRKDIIFSHNDVKMQYGQFRSESGYDVEDIANSCELFINGHIHNHNVSGNIITLGNITGQNFSEDAMTYKHYMMILDTSNMTYEFVENPYAFEFYKFSSSDEEIPFIPDCSRAVLTVKCGLSEVDEIKERYKDCVALRTLIDETSISDVSEDDVQLDTVDHLQQFAEYVKLNIGTDDDTLFELSQVIN